MVCKTLSRKTLHKNRVDGVAQGAGLELNHSTKLKKKKKKTIKQDW
jgi:hypothetical protein